MLIAFSGNTSWSMYNFRIGLMKRFIKEGYDVCVVAPKDDFTDKIIKEGIKFIPINNLKRSGTNPLEDYRLYKEYKAVYQELNPDFIFHYTIKPNIYGTLAAKSCGIPSISITTGLGNAFAKKGLLFWCAKYLYKISSTHAKEVWFLNGEDENAFIKNNIIPKSKSFILPGEGVNLNLFSPGIFKQNDGSHTFLLISRMLYDKGVEIFAEATRILINKGYKINSVLLGQLDNSNPERISLETIQKWAEDGLVKYPGATANVRPYILDADCVVLPSYYKEGIPRVLMEAACMEKPIITTRNRGCMEVVEDGVNGYLCELKSITDLAAKMEKFIHLSEAEKAAMGKAGREKMIEEFDENKIITLYLNRIKKYIPEVKPLITPLPANPVATN